LYNSTVTQLEPPMNAVIQTVVATLDSPEVRAGGFAASQIREQALIDGLHAIAADCKIKLKPTHIDSNGEFAVNAESEKGPFSDVCGPYGEAFASWLSRVPRRTGISASTSPVLPENGWCRINHFDAERLVRLYNKEVNAAPV